MDRIEINVYYVTSRNNRVSLARKYMSSHVPNNGEDYYVQERRCPIVNKAWRIGEDGTAIVEIFVRASYE